MNKYNSEGYPDPTAYYGTKEIIKEETEMEKEVHFLLHIIRDIAILSRVNKPTCFKILCSRGKNILSNTIR